MFNLSSGVGFKLYISLKYLKSAWISYSAIFLLKLILHQRQQWVALM